MYRQASHAGTWYEEDAEELSAQLNNWLEKAAETKESLETKAPKRVVGLIAPHAGFFYSAETAAHAYQYINKQNVQTIFILGPSHHHYLEGCALTQAKFYQTPLGDIEIDQEINQQLKASGEFELMAESVDEQEHSIEMHLPFIAQVMHGKKYKAVPVLVGSTSFDVEKDYGRIFGPFMSDPSVLFVVSTDFCHWGSRFRFQPFDPEIGEIYEFIEHLDHEGIKLLEEQDADAFASYLEKTKNSICGRHPIGIFLHCMLEYQTDGKRLVLKFVKYAQSSKVCVKSDSSVSYASAIVYEPLF